MKTSRRWVRKYLRQTDMQQISDAVRKAELRTSGDIVPMVVRRSSAIGHVPVILALVLALIFVAAGRMFPALAAFYGHWVIELGTFLFLLILAWLLSPLHFVQRALTSTHDEKFQVEHRAHLEFYLQRLNRTHRKTAVLIFVSVMEKRAVVLADEGISQRLPASTWDEVMKLLAEHLSRGEWAAGFTDAIQKTADLLAPHFPPEQGTHELGNHLIVKE